MIPDDVRGDPRPGAQRTEVGRLREVAHGVLSHLAGAYCTADPSFMARRTPNVQGGANWPATLTTDEGVLNPTRLVA